MRQERLFSSAPEALVFMAALNAEGIECWSPDFHMSTLWGGWWNPMSGYRIVWLSDDAGWSVTSTHTPEKTLTGPERFSDVFQSRPRRNAFLSMLWFILFGPIPTHNPEDNLASIQWLYFTANLKDYQTTLKTCFYTNQAQTSAADSDPNDSDFGFNLYEGYCIDN